MKIVLRTPSKRVALLKLSAMKNLGKKGKVKYIRADKVYRVYEL